MSQSELAIVRRKTVALALENKNVKKETTHLQQTSAKQKEETTNLKDFEAVPVGRLASAREKLVPQRMLANCLKRPRQ